MSILFSKKGKSILKWVWVVLATLLIISMVLAYSGGADVFTSAVATQS